MTFNTAIILFRCRNFWQFCTSI